MCLPRLGGNEHHDLMLFRMCFCRAAVTFSVWWAEVCVHLGSVAHVTLFSLIVLLLCKMRSDALPSDVCVVFLFQESRINCIRIARKGNSTRILLLPLTLPLYRSFPATCLSASESLLLSCRGDTRDEEEDHCLGWSTLHHFSPPSQSTNVGMWTDFLWWSWLFSSGPLRKGQHAGRD